MTKGRFVIEATTIMSSSVSMYLIIRNSGLEKIVFPTLLEFITLGLYMLIIHTTKHTAF